MKGPSREVTISLAEELRQYCVFNAATFHEEVSKTPDWLVANLIRTSSVNILVGNSGLGKTPLCLSLSIAIASGLPILGQATRQGRVLYCDAENGKAAFGTMLRSISTLMGLEKAPANLWAWSPNWDESNEVSADHRLMEVVGRVKPQFVVVDTLRSFFHQVDKHSDDAARFVRRLRDTRAAWLLVHHRRKSPTDRPGPSLLTETHAWFEEAAGTLALINLTDSRIGLVPMTAGRGELLVGGFARGDGLLPHIHLARVHGDDGVPMGYALATGSSMLGQRDAQVLNDLPDQFRFKDVQLALGGNSGSNTGRLLKQFVAYGCATQDETSKVYKKVKEPGVSGADGFRPDETSV